MSFIQCINPSDEVEPFTPTELRKVSHSSVSLVQLFDLLTKHGVEPRAVSMLCPLDKGAETLHEVTPLAPASWPQRG